MVNSLENIDKSKVYASRIEGLDVAVAEQIGNASDNKSINLNASSKLQTVGVIDNNNTSNAIKTWTGTRSQYDAILVKDANTLYNITDDTNVSFNLLELIYPVGSVYITTANTCPLSLLISGSTWTLVSSGIVNAGNIPCKGNGMTLGLTDGTNNIGLMSPASGSASGLSVTIDAYGKSVGTDQSASSLDFRKTKGITTDSSKSGIVVDTTSFTLSVNIFERTA